MSPCVMSNNANPHSHFPTQDPTDSSFAGNLSDDLFDSSFSFMNNDNGMEYYLASPPDASGARSPDPNQREDQAGPSEQQQQDHAAAQAQHAQQHAPFSMSPLTLHDQSMDLAGGGYSYPPYAIPYANHGATAGAHPSGFHPYRSSMTGTFAHSPRSPKSPSLSSSPHGSINSNRFSFNSGPGAPTAVSPALVSPASLNGSIPEPSPTNPYIYHYPLYQHAGPGGGMGGVGGSGTPLTAMSNLANVSPTGPGMSMVAGFPYPTSVLSQSPIGKNGRGAVRNTRGAAAASMAGGRRSRRVKQEEDDDDEDDEEEEDEEGGSPEKGGLGLSNATDDRVPVPSKREDVRKARIESEQRRRDELREGFKRLKDALPQTSQRASKSSLLDRSVQHIQAIEGANRYLLQQLDEATKECAKLREILHSEVKHRTASNSPDQPGMSRHH
ncbi:hypothetical protein IAT38_005144 [Cryptococcus sp. DSM 104549]